MHLRTESSQTMPFITLPHVVTVLRLVTLGGWLALSLGPPPRFHPGDHDVCFFVNNRELRFLETQSDTLYLLRGKVTQSIHFFLIL